MTEHSAVVFVFFFLAEYASIVLISILITVLFLGGYLINIDNYLFYLGSNALLEGGLYGLVLGVKACSIMFTFIWIRASLPRIRFDQLMSFCWLKLLPIVVAFIFFIPCILYSFIYICNNSLLL